MGNDNSLELLVSVQTQGQEQIDALAGATKNYGDTVASTSGKIKSSLEQVVAALEAEVKSHRNVASAAAQASMAQLEALGPLGQVTAARLKAATAATQSADAVVKAAQREADARDLAYRRMASAMDAAAREDAKRTASSAAEATALVKPLTQVGYATGLVDFQMLSLARGIGGVGTVAGAAVLGLVGVALALGEGAKAAFNLVKEFGAAERETANLATRLGITIGQAEKLTAEAGLTGVSMASLETSARLLGEALEHPDEQGRKTAKSLAELGISTTDLQGNMVDLGPVILQVLDKLSLIKNDAERAALGQELLGRGSKTLQPLIANYQQLQDVVSKLHIGEDAAGSKELLDADTAVKTLDLSWTQFKKHLAEAIAPIVIPVVRALTPDGSSNPLDPNWMAKHTQADLDADRASALEAQKATGKATAFRASDDKTKQGLDDQLKDATKQRDDLRAALRGGQIGNDDFDKDKTQYDAAVASIARVQKALDGIKTSKKESNAYDAEAIALRHEGAELDAKEVGAIGAIEVKRLASIAHLKDENKYTAEQLRLLDSIVNQNAAKATTIAGTKAIAEGIKYGTAARKKTDADQIKEDNRTSDIINDEWLTYMDGLQKSIQDAQNKDAATKLHVANSGDQSDSYQVRQRAALAIYQNNKGTGSGSHGGSSAADANYQVRIKAAQDVFQIETRHLDLITEEGKREDALADAKKKAEDELYAAQREHEEALDALREKDIQKYHALAESVFDALTDRMHGSGFDFRNMARGAAKNLGSQVFANATTPIFQAAGHTLAGLSGGSTFGGLLKGTVFDPANKGVHADPQQSKIVDNTKTIADWAQKTYELWSGQTASDPAGANSSASPIGAASASGMLTNPLSAMAAMNMASLPAALSGNASGLLANPLTAMAALATASLPAALGGTATTASSAASGLAGIMKAITGGTGTAFGAGASSVLSGGALGNVLYGGPAYGGSTMSQVGSAVGLAGALGSSALAIASGLGQGGVAGGLKAAGGAVGAATTLASNIAPLLNTVLPAAIPVIGSVIAAALPLISGLFGTGPQQRANQITNELAQNQFLPNTALDTIQNTNGTLLSMDAHGNLRTSSLNALPTVAEPYITSERLNGSPYRTYANAPGGVTQGYSGSVTGTGQAPVSNAPGITIHLNAIDTQSGIDFIMKNHPAVGAALAEHLHNTDGQAAHAIRFITNS